MRERGLLVRDWLDYTITSDEIEFYLKNYKVLIVN
jgi:hypothetical protein